MRHRLHLFLAVTPHKSHLSVTPRRKIHYNGVYLVARMRGASTSASTEMSDVIEHRDGRSQFLVVHDYGMGGLWWWVRARSADEIIETCAEVEVVDDPEVVRRMVAEGDLEEVDLDALEPGSALAGLRDQRSSYRGKPGYGELVGLERVHLRIPHEDDDDAVWLAEFGPDGRWTRQVEVRPGRRPVRRSAEDWPINPPIDLYDPKYVEHRMDAAEFEKAWEGARPEQ